MSKLFSREKKKLIALDGVRIEDERKSRNCRSTPSRKAQAPYPALVSSASNHVLKPSEPKTIPIFFGKHNFKPGSGAVHFHISHAAPASPAAPMFCFFQLATRTTRNQIFSASFSGDPGSTNWGVSRAVMTTHDATVVNYRCSKELGSFSDILGWE